MKKTMLYFCLLILSISNLFSQQNDFPKLTGPYLGQTLPGNTPESFASEFFNQFDFIRDGAFTPDGKEFYFTSVENGKYTIMFSKFDSTWSPPAQAFFSGESNDFELCTASDGQKLFFASMRSSKEKEEMENDIDIWKIEKQNGVWGKPKPLDRTINTKCMEYYPSVASNGNLYFVRNDLNLTRGDIYFSKLTNGNFEEPEKLPEVVNLPTIAFNAFVAPDESYLIFSTYIQADSIWHSNLLISFRNQDGSWSKPKDFGNKINSLKSEYSPWVSHDGKYFFYSSSDSKKGDIYWVDAKIIEELRPKE